MRDTRPRISQSTKKTTPARAEAARQPVTSRRDQGRAEDCVHNVRPRDGAHGGAARRFQPGPSDGDATRAPPHDPAGENNAQAGLLMQMFITYAQEQRADSNHVRTDPENTG